MKRDLRTIGYAKVLDICHHCHHVIRYEDYEPYHVNGRCLGLWD